MQTVPLGASVGMVVLGLIIIYLDSTVEVTPPFGPDPGRGPMMSSLMVRVVVCAICAAIGLGLGTGVNWWSANKRKSFLDPTLIEDDAAPGKGMRLGPASPSTNDNPTAFTAADAEEHRGSTAEFIRRRRWARAAHGWRVGICPQLDIRVAVIGRVGSMATTRLLGWSRPSRQRHRKMTKWDWKGWPCRSHARLRPSIPGSALSDAAVSPPHPLCRGIIYSSALRYTALPPKSSLLG